MKISNENDNGMPDTHMDDDKIRDENKSWYKYQSSINNNHINAHYNLGNTYKHLGKYQKALDCYERVIEIDHNNISAYNNQGVIFYQLGEYRKTKNCYDKIRNFTQSQ